MVFALSLMSIILSLVWQNNDDELMLWEYEKLSGPLDLKKLLLNSINSLISPKLPIKPEIPHILNYFIFLKI